ncbi:MAG: class I SAM-dependent methyltransferase [Alphaproteobacteria bacterium]|nr:class I SAM-dependent methyltransferase [Alphaproteobacteria bacterium]
MPRSKVIQYFNDHASSLSAQYNSLDRAKVHADLMRFLPVSQKLRMLDIGAGSGADAGFFAALGHEVVAAEPAKNLREMANKTFKNKKIEWVADKLPHLKSVTASGKKFDVIYAVGTLQYLDKKDRMASLDKMASLLKADGLLEIQYPTPRSREHQFSIDSREIAGFVKLFNKAAQGNFRLKVIHRKNIKDFSGRKALDGSDLYFNTTIIKYLKSPANKPKFHG